MLTERSVHYTSRIQCSILTRTLVPNFPTDLATYLQWHVDSVHSASPRVRAALANPQDNTEHIWMWDATYQISCRSAQNWSCIWNKEIDTETFSIICVCQMSAAYYLKQFSKVHHRKPSELGLRHFLLRFYIYSELIDLWLAFGGYSFMALYEYVN